MNAFVPASQIPKQTESQSTFLENPGANLTRKQMKRISTIRISFTINTNSTFQHAILTSKLFVWFLSALNCIILLPNSACLPVREHSLCSHCLLWEWGRREFEMVANSVVKSLTQHSSSESRPRLSTPRTETVTRGRQQHGFLTHHQYCSC